MGLLSKTAKHAAQAFRTEPAEYYEKKKDYVLDEGDTALLGLGGSARVVRAKSLKLNHDIAMKIVRKDAIVDHKRYIRIVQKQIILEGAEGRVLKMYDWFQNSSHYYLALELAMGGDMMDRLEKYGAWSEVNARATLGRLLDAVAWIHSQGMVHRDIKLENLLYRNLDDPLDFGLADFGIAHVLDDSVNADDYDASPIWDVSGTPGFSAPEIFLRKGHGKKADLYSVGILGYTIFSNWSPWASRDARSLIRESTQTDVVFYANKWGHISEEAMQLIAALTSRNPRDRPTPQAARQFSWFQMSGDPAASASQTANQDQRTGMAGGAPLRQQTLRSTQGGGAPAQVLTRLPTLRDETLFSQDAQES